MQNPLDFTSGLKVIYLKCYTNNRARVNKPTLQTCLSSYTFLYKNNFIRTCGSIFLKID